MGDLLKPAISPVVSGIVVGVIVLLAQLLILPIIERRKTVEQERWKAKREAFLSAIKLVDKHLAHASWSGPQVPSDYMPVKEKPSGTEINDVLSQLILISGNYSGIAQV